MEVGGADRHALRAGAVEKAEQPLGAGERFAFAVDAQPVLAGGEFDAESAFGVDEVFFPAGVQGRRVARTGETESLRGHGCGISGAAADGRPD